MKYHTILFFLVFLLNSAVHSQIILPDDEAPTALIDADIGSSNVELLSAGSWEASLTGSIGYTFPVGAPSFLSQYPGMTQGIVFKQVPDLLLSLWLNSSLFF